MHYVPQEPELSHVGGNTIGGNPDTFFPHLWAWMILKMNIRSVFDVGCGEGHALREFKRLGCKTEGFDGAPRNAAIAADAGAYVHDLTKGPCIAKKRPDLIWCCEVVGQVEIQYIKNVLETLSQGDVLAITTEQPNQPGHNHVNCREPKFWEAALFDSGMEVDRALTIESKKYAHAYWAFTGTIYRRIK